MKQLFALLIIMLLGQVGSTALVQWTVESGGNDHYYDAILDPGISWEAADAAADARGAGWHLATITSQIENQFVIDLFESNPDFKSNALNSSLVGPVRNGPWIGGYSSSASGNDWKWVTGESFSFSAWGSYEPFGNGEKLVFSFFGTSQVVVWNDLSSTYPAAPPTGYILENDTIPEPATLSLLAFGGLALLRKRK